MCHLFSPLAGPGGNGAKAYQCSGCNGLIASSDHLLTVGGKHLHLFVNPAGVECRFYTFSSCPGASAKGFATEEYTWFPGYQWRFVFCRACGQHLGWHYEAVSDQVRPGEFWGILIAHLLVR